MTRSRRGYAPSGSASNAHRLGLLLLGAGLFVILLWLSLSAMRLVRAANSLLTQQERLEALLEDGILNANATVLEQIVVTVRDDVTEIESVIGPLAPLGRYFGWLPGLGPLAADAGPLLEMADAGSEMAIYGIAVLRPVLAGNQEQGAALVDLLPQLVDSLDSAQPQLRSADAAAGRLLAARSDLQNADAYPERLAALIERMDEYTGLLNDGLKLGQVAPELLGQERPMTYLVLAQNEDELRPTGGFISGAGLLTLSQGQIVDLTFDNANAVDDWRNKPYDLPPAPFTQFMGMDIFLFRDANFWPDFARSAAQAGALYTYGREIPVDGVIAIDQHFLQQLLAVSGPLPVPELERIVDANTVVNQLREEWGPSGDGGDWISERKAFMGPLAAAFLAQLNSGMFSTSGAEMVTMLQRAAEQRHLQLHAVDPAIAAALGATVWSGRLDAHGAGDFLHVSDTNMGFNKVNATVQRSLTYQVTLAENSPPQARLDVRYVNPPAARDIDCLPGTRYDLNTTYESLIEDCYWNYVRIYVPLGSQLNSSSEHPVPATNLLAATEWPGITRTATSDGGAFAVFDNFLLLEPGQEATLSLQYAPPETIVTVDGRHHTYRLLVRKQAGTVADPLSISLTLPDGAQLRSVNPQPSRMSGNTLFFDLKLESDVHIDIDYNR